jgi:short-subunit dehydrogenase
MVARGDGYLFQTASSVAFATHPEKAAYSVTKHGALALSEWLAAQYRPKGVKVSCFCPGPMLTGMLLANDFGPDHPILSMAATPEHVADLVVECMREEKFLLLTQPGDEHVLIDKGTDYNGWIERSVARISLPAG